MAQSDISPAVAVTRTSETNVVPGLLERPPRPASSSSTPTLPLEPAKPDPAAVSFALERERVLRRCEHTASVQRLHKAITIGIPFWLGALGLDVWALFAAGAGTPLHFVTLRLVGTAAALLVMWRLRRAPEPSPLQLAVLDVGLFALVSALGGLLIWSYGTIDSPHATGLIMILVARGATTLAPWRRGVWMMGVPALSFALVMLLAVLSDPNIAAQVRDPAKQVSVGFFLTFLSMTWILLTLGGDFAWRLRREALETRNIGRYQLERLLGRGGMGEVWAAYDTALKHRVALKTVAGHRPGSSVLGRLEREARALAELTHPNTVRVFDYGVTDDGLWYYTMELLHGANLHDLVQSTGPLPQERLTRLASQVLRALGEAHAKGIIHRDIKPENVFVAELGGESDIAKLLDFGMAKATVTEDQSLTRTGRLAGTPAYMPPEIILGQDADARSDVYSFGATLYFAATGKLPFTDATQIGLFAAHIKSAPPPLSEASTLRFSPEFEQLVQRCMAKEPGARFPSTQAVLQALESRHEA